MPAQRKYPEELILGLFALTDKTSDMAEASTRMLLDLLGWPGTILRSSELSARPGRSQRLADLAVITGARSYLCGTGGMKYLEAGPFTSRGITVTAFRTPDDERWRSEREITAIHALMRQGVQALADQLRTLARDHVSLAAQEMIHSK